MGCIMGRETGATDSDHAYVRRGSGSIFGSEWPSVRRGIWSNKVATADKIEELAARLADMVKAAGVTEMSPSDLRAYMRAVEERLLENRDRFAIKTVRAVRRARTRAQSGDQTSLGKLLAEELEKEAEANVHG